jgi:chorismate synthase
MLRYLTAGESHGQCLIVVIEGCPAGFPIDAQAMDHDMWRRQQGHGRGGRMAIEQDQARILSGVRWGETLGSPIALLIENHDWKNWEKTMSPRAEDRDDKRVVTRPRPGHADLTGALKYDHSDLRNVLERASARETAARVAVGALCKCLLAPFGIRVYGYVVAIGDIKADHAGLTPEQIFERAERSPVRVADQTAEARMIESIDECQRRGDTLGGVVEAVAVGLPPGLGSYVHWDRKLDGRLAHALLSIQATKGVEIGLGFEMARRPGSAVHDELSFGEEGFERRTNNAGGTEGGMSTGAPLVARVAFKPLSTLMKPLQSVDIRTKADATAAIERSDVCAVPAAAVITEAVMATVIAQAFIEKFGGDSFAEVRRNYEGYREHVRAF